MIGLKMRRGMSAPRNSLDLVPKLCLGTQDRETPFREAPPTGNGVSRSYVPKRSLGTRVVLRCLRRDHYLFVFLLSFVEPPPQSGLTSCAFHWSSAPVNSRTTWGFCSATLF